jgi:cytoskeletal protein CcmA (bactofilin family)
VQSVSYVYVEARMSNGQSIVIKGDISGSEDLVIAGRVEGSIKLDGRVLTLAAGSHVVGEVAAGTVVVAGTVEGTVEAEDRLEVRSTAIVDGELSTARLIVADGSQICARVDMPDRESQKPRLAKAV